MNNTTQLNFATTGRKFYASFLTTLGLLLLLLSSSLSFGQNPSVLYTSLTSTTPAPSNSRFALTTMSGVFKQARFQANQTASSGTTFWAFHQGSTGSPDYTNNWRPYTSGNTMSTNTYIPIGFANGARYNNNGGSDGQLPAITSGNYYTFNVTNNTSDNIMQLLETTYNPVTVTAVTQAAGTFGSRVVTITTSGTPNASENIYVRYSTNSYAASTLVQATGSGTTWTATIPWQSSAVSFYVYTSNKTISQINTDVTNNSSQTPHDMATLNLNNNAGANYSWTPATGAYIVTSTTGTSANTAVGYATLTTATTGLFAVLNAGTVHTGTVTVLVTADVTTEPGTTVLSNSAAWTSLTINPNGARTISGAAAAGAPLISLSGADNVTFNGLNTGGNSLTISNTTASATSGTCTFSFTGDATSNTITNCTVLGSASPAVFGTNGGVFIFGAGAVTVGNDNNTISNCNIGPAGANLPLKAFHFGGTTTTTVLNNSGITINNNNIYDYFGAGVQSAGIYVTSGTTDINITNNKFYQTASRTQTTGTIHSAIYITNTSGNNYVVTGNTIGFASSTGTGSYSFVATSSSQFIPIYLNVGTTTATSVQGNTIKAIAITGSGSGTGTSGPFIGIYTASGLSTIGDVTGNTIGDMTTTGSITFTSSSTSTSDINGIYNFGSSNWTTNNNNIGGITVSNSSTGAVGFYGLRCNTGSGVTWTCNSNTIGGSVAFSLDNTCTATGSTSNGILNSNPIGTFTGNIIRNMRIAGGTGTTTASSMIGIRIDATSAQTVSQNQIYNLSNSNTGASAVTVIGIRNASTATNTFSKNLIYNFGVATSVASNVTGLEFTVSTGTNTVSNNMIRLGYDATGAVLAGGHALNGIFVSATGTTNNFYFNSVYVGGTGVTGSTATYAFNNTSTGTRIIRNNIFSNARSNGTGTGKHYAIKEGSTTGLTINYNDYFANGTGGVLGILTTDRATLAAWQTATTQDGNSQNGDPQFIAPTSATPDLHIHATNPTPIEGTGLVVATVTDDYDGQTRSGLTPTDMGADAGNFVSSIAACATPTAQPTALTFSAVTTTTLSGSFTAASPVPTGYIVIRSTSSTLSGNPLDGNSYTAGASLGGGTVIVPTGTTFTDSALTAGTTYYYFVLSYNSGACSGGPKYLTTTPLTNSQATVCATASALAAGTLTSTSATLTWTGAGNYIVEYGAAGFTPGTGATAGAGGTIATSAATTPYVLSGLTSNTTYDVYVRQVCAVGGFYSANATKVTFTTLQTPATLPYTQNFTTNDFSFVNGAQTNKWVYGTAAGNPANSLYVSNDSGVTNAYTITSASVVQTYRDIAIPAGTTLTSFSFDWKANGESCCDYLRVWLAPTTFTPTAGTQITAGGGIIQVGGNLNVQTAWQTYSSAVLDLTSFANTTMRLIFEWRNDGSLGTTPPAAIDNISLSIPACSVPTLTATTAIAETTATINWTAPASAPSNGYNYEVRTSGTAGSGATGLTTSGSVGAGILTANITGLTAATTYSVYVQSNCGGSGTSSWTTAGTFTTACTVPNNPGAISVTAPSATGFTLNYAAASPAPTSYILFYTTGTTLTSIPALVNGTSYTNATPYTFGGNTYNCITNASVSPNVLSGGISNTQYNYFLFSKSSTNSCFGAPYYSSGVTVSTITCPAAPTLPVNSAVTTTGATVSWTASVVGGGAATINYTLEVYTDSGYTTPISGSPFSMGTSVSQSLTGLSGSTTYYYRIKANNGSCDSTYLTGTFTTTCGSLNVPYSQNFDTTTPPATPNCMTVVDSNADGITWTNCTSTSLGNATAISPNSGANHMGIRYSGTVAMDDWFFLPGLNLTGSTSYRVSFYARGYTGLNEIFEVKYGTAASAASMTTSIATSTTLVGGTAYTKYSYDFTPSSTGVYNIGIHGMSIANQWYMFIDDINVTVTPDPITITPSPSATICNGDSTTLTASSTAGYTYTWSPATGLSATTGASVSANPTATTIYTVTGVAGAMTTTQAITVTVNPAPAAITITPSATTCPNVVTTLTASSASIGTYTVGTSSGTSVAANTPYRQAVGAANQSRVQYLISKAELNAAGINSAANLTSLGFNVTTAGSGTMSNYTISMTNTNLTVLTATYQTPTFTTVFSGTNILPVSGINTHTFSSPFAWDGTSNILINICHQGAGGTASTVSIVTPTNVSTTSGGGSNQCNLTSGGATNANRPVMIFGVAGQITWAPTTDLYTDSGATTSYSGGAAVTVYTKPTATITYTATASLGSCTKTNTTTITTKIPVGITSVTAGASPICSTATTSLTANGVVGTNNTVTWYSGTGGTGTNLGTGLTLSNVGPGTYYARVTGDCGSPAEASVTVAAKVNVGITSATAAASTICATATTTLTANGVVGDGAVVTWYTGSGATGTNLGTGTTLTAGPGTYYAYVTGDCGSPAEATVTVGTKVNVAITGISAAANPICASATTTLTANGVVGAGAVVTWYTGSGATGTNLGIGTTLIAGPGTYYAYVTGDCGAPQEANYVINTTAVPTYANLQFPGSGAVCLGGTFTSYGQVYQAGITEAAGAGSGITAQFGYSSTNSDPSTWTNWSTASFNVQSGNNDEFTYTFSPPSSGTYYYTYRYRQGTCDWLYGGYSGTGGGFWNGTSNVSGVLTVNPNTTPTFDPVAAICAGSSLSALPTTSNNGITGTWSPALDNTTTTVYTFTPTAGQCATTATLTITVGGVVTWNGSAWDNVTGPTSTDAVVFTGNYTVSSDLTACSLTINGGVVTVDPGKNVYLSGSVTVTTGSLTFNSSANLMQSDPNAVNTGDIFVKRASKPLMRLDYTAWSSPVAGQELYAFSPFTFANRFYVYDSPTNLYSNSIGTTALLNVTGTNAAGVNGTDSNHALFLTGRGYLIRLPYNHPTTPAVWTGSFKGVPNNGTKTFSLVTQTASTNGYNLVGNPYPSDLSIDQFATDNASNIEETLYFWRKTNNPNLASYCTWNTSTHSFTSNVAANASLTPATTAHPYGVIGVGQGFIVQAKNGASSLVFNNGQRTVDSEDRFFRPGGSATATATTESHRIWLNMTGATDEFSQTLVGYFTDGTLGMDATDSKFLNDGTIAINTKVGAETLVMQGRPVPFDATDVVPLNFKVTNAGTYTIAIDHVDGLFTGGAQTVYIKDNTDGSYHDITSAPFSFTSAAGTFDTRFELVYQNLLSTDTNTFTTNSINVIHQSNNDVVVNTSMATMATVRIFDIRGRLLIEKKDINANETRINVGTTNQVLLVQVTTVEGYKAVRKVVN